MTYDRFLILILRAVGTVAGSAVFCAMMPLRTMDTVHRALGLGPLPNGPIVEYLARSTSARYALLGVLLWVFSFDLIRYRPLVRGAGFALVALGLLLFWTDLKAGLPWFWQGTEGPLNVLIGILLLLAERADGVRHCVLRRNDAD